MLILGKLGILPAEAEVSVIKIDTRFQRMADGSIVPFETIAHFKLVLV